MSSRKDELIEAIIGYLLDHGLADVSLRPLAAATGTSARLLIYHFGSKEKLLTEVLETMQSKLRRSFAQLQEDVPDDSSTRQPIKLFWDWATAKENRPYLKLMYELQVLAMHNPAAYEQYLQRNAMNWLEVAFASMPDAQRSTSFATLCCAVFDGLFIELMSTGDLKRTTLALEEFIRIARNDLANRRPP